MSDRTKRLKALGNAVVPQCAFYIGRRIIEAINGLPPETGTVSAAQDFGGSESKGAK